MRFVLLKLTSDSMPDHPGPDWHRRVRDTLAELAAAPEIGGSLAGLAWTLGPYDAMIQVDMPSDEAAMAFSLTTARKLRSQTTTLTALDDEAMDTAMGVVDIRNGMAP